VPIGTRDDGEAVTVPSHDLVVLIAGPAASGKSTLALGLMERLAQRAHQICVVDPEGDYEAFGDLRLGVRGDDQAADHIFGLLEPSVRTVAADLLELPMVGRPRFCIDLLAGVGELHRRAARPHWLVLDEAHHLLPPMARIPLWLRALVMVTIDPAGISPVLLARVDVVIATGNEPYQTLRTFCLATDEPSPGMDPIEIGWGEALLWQRRTAEGPVRLQTIPTRTAHRRHRRKYAQGAVGYAPNLARFLEIADQAGDVVWLFHLCRGDYENWFRRVIKDDDLAEEGSRIAVAIDFRTPAEARNLVHRAIVRRYAGPG
jgi:hypothetical protein